MLVDGTLTQARMRLRDVTQRPEVAGDLADELSATFHVLRNYAHFADYQRRELDELCQELDQL